MGYKMDICQVAALRIRKMRLEKNMTIDDLAEKCDVSTQTIKLIEAGSSREFDIRVNNRGSDLSGFNTVKVCGNFKEGRD